MSGVEAFVLIPLLLVIIILNMVVADALRVELEGVKALKVEVERCLNNTTKIVNGSLPP
jgi:hypothetical protein